MSTWEELKRILVEFVTSIPYVLANALWVAVLLVGICVLFAILIGFLLFIQAVCLGNPLTWYEIAAPIAFCIACGIAMFTMD